MSPATSKQTNLTVFVVDDSAVVRKTLCDLLSFTPGIEICGAGDSVATALAGVAEKKPDVVLLDLNLPGGTGLDVLQAVRVAVPKAVVIVFTMHSFQDLGWRCLEAGARHFFEKTGDLEPLLTVMAGLAWRKNPTADFSVVATAAESNRQKARTHEVLLRDVTESSAECISVLDLDARLLWVNQVGQAAMGLAAGVVASRPCWVDYFEGPHRDTVNAALATAKRVGLAHLSVPCRTLDGISKWWEIVVTSIMDEQGTPAKFVVVSRDITLRRSAVARMIRQLDQLELDVDRSTLSRPQLARKQDR